MEIKNALKELETLFDGFNKSYFGGELKRPIIIIQTNGRKKNVLGWCTVHQVWVNKESNVKEYEITICAEFLNRDIYEIAATMLHEMVHLYNINNDIRDVNSNGKTHNKKFKDQAEKRGLIIEKAPGIGWSLSTLTEESKNIVDSLNINKEHLLWNREIVEPTQPKRKTSESHKYYCPNCGAKFTSKRELHAVCVDCDVPFVED